MLVQQILNSKGISGVISVKPSTLLADVASLLAEKHIGGVIVSEDGKKAAGIISERDIVRVMAARGKACFEVQVGDVMTKALKTCGLEDTADDIMQRMTDGRFRHMPVEDKGEMVGMVTIGDLVKARLSELSMEKEALEGMIMGY